MTIDMAQQEKPFLSLFWELSSAHEKIRIKAIDSLVAALSASQTRFLDTKPDSYSLALADYEKWNLAPVQTFASLQSSIAYNESENGPTSLSQPLPIDAVVSTDLSYSLKRLVRGLATHKTPIRMAFSQALLALLINFPILSIKLTLQLIENLLTPVGNMKSTEETDYLVGKLCGWTCIYQSLKLSSSSPKEAAHALKKERSVSSMALHLDNMLRDMICHMDKKSYLREGLGILLTDLYRQVEGECPNLSSSLAQFILSKLKKDHALIYNAEVLALILLIQEKEETLLEKCGLSIDRIKSILAESHSSHPRLHVVWDILLEKLVTRSCPILGLDFKTFWKTFVDESLFHSTSHEKKYLGFLLFEKTMALAVLNGQSTLYVDTLFSPHFVRVLSHSLANPKNLLFKAGSTIFDAVVRISEGHSDLALANIYEWMHVKHLFTGPPLVRQTIERLTRLLDDSDLTKLENELELRITQSTSAASDPKYVEMNRQYYLDTLLHLFVKKSQTLSVKGIALESLLKSIVQFMVRLLHDTSLPLSTLTIVRNRFISLLGDLASLDSLAKSALAIPGLMSNGTHWFSYTLSLFKRPNAHSMADTNDASLATCLKFMDRIATMNKTTHSDSRQLKAFELLFSSLALQLHALPDSEQNAMMTSTKDTETEADISSSVPAILAEIATCFDRVFTSKPEKATKKRKTVAETTPSSDLEPIEVLTDLLLSLLAKPEAFYRSICQRVFYLLRDTMNENAYALILQALDQEEQEEMASSSSSPSTASDSENDHDSDGDHEEEMTDASDAEMQTDDESGLSPSDSESDNVSKSEMNFSAETHLQDPLEDLTDEQMAVYDEKLANIFFAKQKAMKESRAAISNEYHFKHKVLSLLDECLRGNEPFSPLLLDMIVPLLELASRSENSTGSELEKKVKLEWSTHIRHWLSNRLFMAKNLPRLSQSTQALDATFDFLVARLTRATETEMSIRNQREEEKTLTLGFIFVARILTHAASYNTAADASPLHSKLTLLLTSSFAQGSKSPCPSPKFYEEWISRLPVYNYALMLPALTRTLSVPTLTTHQQLVLAELIVKVFKSSLSKEEIIASCQMDDIHALFDCILSKMKSNAVNSKTLHSSWLSCLNVAFKKLSDTGLSFDKASKTRYLNAMDDLKQHWQSHQLKALVNAVDHLKLKLTVSCE